jgi:hypothetical protein
MLFSCILDFECDWRRLRQNTAHFRVYLTQLHSINWIGLCFAWSWLIICHFICHFKSTIRESINIDFVVFVWWICFGSISRCMLWLSSVKIGVGDEKFLPKPWEWDCSAYQITQKWRRVQMVGFTLVDHKYLHGERIPLIKAVLPQNES